MSAAARLDAADGVIDGRHFGRPIIQAGAPQFGGQVFGAQPAFGGQFVQSGVPQFGGFAGQSIIGQPQFGGQIFGAQPAFGGQFIGGQSIIGGQQFGTGSAAAALDAADGVIDGRHFGRPIVQAGAPQFGGQFIQSGISQFGAQPFGGQFIGGQSIIGGGFPTTFGGASSAATALDAADGVIDGRHFGRPIIQAGAPQIIGQPQFGGFAGQSIIGGTQFGGFPQQFGAQTLIGQPQFGGQLLGAQSQFGAAGAAARLDAADGVIDGRFFGRPIVRQ